MSLKLYPPLSLDQNVIADKLDLGLCLHAMDSVSDAHTFHISTFCHMKCEQIIFILLLVVHTKIYRCAATHVIVCFPVDFAFLFFF